MKTFAERFAGARSSCRIPRPEERERLHNDGASREGRDRLGFEPPRLIKYRVVG